MFVDKQEAIKIMNKFGDENTPFFFMINFEAEEAYISHQLETSKILFNINGIKNYTDKKIFDFPEITNKIPITFDKYKSCFYRVEEEISKGNTYLLNLTFPTIIEFNYSLSEIFYASKAKYKILFDESFVVFSPETFVTINGSQIVSRPMKGTIDASIPNAEEKILNDEKETAEHYTIVDLIRNDLSIVSKNVRVEQFRYIDKIKSKEKDLLQVSSKIVGDLQSDFNSILGEIIFALLPAGSISGAPKKKTLEIIKNIEVYNRGYYTGIAGYYDGHNLDTGVMIRFIERINDSLVYKSGGGITYLSDASNEYQELLDKIYVPIH